MRTIMILLLTLAACIPADAYKYTYTFKNIPVSEALVKICKDHPDDNISFIYKELDNYRTYARIRTDNLHDALRQTAGLNPVSVIRKGNDYYVEALQHGRYRYTGRTTGSGGEPVAAATVMLLAPSDSTVLTYGITDSDGRFSIPCDRRGVIGKMSCLGYKTIYKRFHTFSVGTIEMKENVVSLGNVTVEGDNACLYSDKSIYIPTSRQKNSSQTALDLIDRMAIPQLKIGGGLSTTTGQPVEAFIDFVPATENELKGMRMEDVKRIEYYDYPADPRFQGKSHVVNFIMQKYEYGGYLKALYADNFVTSRQLNGYTKIQYRKMTFDWAGGLFFMNDHKSYENTYETFRLPQDDGSVKEFSRTSEVDKSRKRKNTYWTSVKALYRTDNVAISNMLTVDFDHTPHETAEGKVTYIPEDYKSTEYVSRNSNRINSFIYNGYWYFQLTHGNSLSFNPKYAYSHTNQHSFYDEGITPAIVNGAVDNSHQASGDLSFAHSFGKAGTLKATCEGQLLLNNTSYSGTSDISDKARTYRLGPGVSYSYDNSKFYGNIGLGLYWDRTEYGSIKENSSAPWLNLSLQYAFDRKNSVSADFNYRKWAPTSDLRSEAVVQAYPLMSYTGNPSIVPFDSYSISGNYTFIPDKKFSFSTFGFAWIVDNRYVWDYEASSTGILRTVKQPMGKYAQWKYGVQGSARLLDNSLNIRLSAYVNQSHNGEPYNYTKSKLGASLSAYYYLGNVYFNVSYSTPRGEADGLMVGTWMKHRDMYSFQAGWSNSHWNLRFFARNFFRYNTYMSKGVMNSKYYDSVSYIYTGSCAGFFQISATYTFGFGKKVQAGNEAYQATGASSGILK